MVYVNDVRIVQISDLSDRSQSILSLIKGGAEWLIWAIDADNVPPVQANDSDDLLRAIQIGLHVDDELRFNSFRASIEKILTFSDADIERLAQVKKSSKDGSATLSSLLQSNGIHSYATLREVNTFVTSSDLDRPDLFQVLSFSDHLCMLPLINDLTNVSDDERKRILHFAVGKASNINEFVDLCNFYRTASLKLQSAKLKAAKLNNKISDIYNQLLPYTNKLLFCHSSSGIKNDESFDETIKNITENTYIGCATNTSAVLNLAENLEINDLQPENIDVLIDEYLDTIKNFISGAGAGNYSISQDGKMAIMKYEDENHIAFVGVGISGNVFLLPGTKIVNN